MNLHPPLASSPGSLTGDLLVWALIVALAWFVVWMVWADHKAQQVRRRDVEKLRTLLHIGETDPDPTTRARARLEAIAFAARKRIRLVDVEA